MQLFRKIGDELIIVYGPTESVEVGETLKLEEGERGIIAQVIESSLLDLPGILEEVVRSEIIEEGNREIGSGDFALYSTRMRNMRFARCKIRKEIQKGEIVDWTGYSPSRDVGIDKLAEDKILSMIRSGIELKHPISLGQGKAGEKVAISAFDLQGLTLVVGRKGMGKSHSGKSLLLGLLTNDAICVVFDVNDEYAMLGHDKNGNLHDQFGESVEVRRPGENLKFTLAYMGQEVFLKLLESIGVAEASLYQVRDMWERLSHEDDLTWEALSAAVAGITDARIKGSLERRFGFLQGTRLITDSDQESASLEKIFSSKEGKATKTGKALVVSLKGLDRVVMRATVQTILSRLQMLLEDRVIPPVFIFAEEAHLYLDETDWVQAVTRIRHLGMFQIYLTNTPTRVPNLIVRQVDNLLLFHLDLEEDARHVAPASRMDEQSVNLVARALPARQFVAVGPITGEFPIQLSTVGLPTQAAGETILRYKEK